MAPTRAQSDPLIGRIVSGRYRVESLLGQGGMGRVYRAQQMPLGRSVALKVISAKFYEEDDPEFHRRFFHEAAIMARLTSPHTVTVFDYGCDRDVYFMAMELVSGQSLDRVLREGGAMRPERVLAIAHQVCRSLREAHAKGVVHRDLKPGNVILTLTEDGEETVKLMDFGLAKRLATVEDTGRDVLPGSPKYMAPEAIRKQPVDGRTDIYALGVMLYHMLTGAVPFDRDNPVDILNAHLHELPPAMSAMNPRVQVAPAFEALVMRCLAKNPGSRCRNMQEVLDALRAVAVQLGVSVDSGLFAPSLAPPQEASTPSKPALGGPSLRLAPGDVTPSVRHPVSEWNWARVGPLVAAVVLLLVFGVYWASGESADKVANGGSQEAASDSKGVPKAAPAGSASQEKADADMVFTVNELDKGEPGREQGQAANGQGARRAPAERVGAEGLVRVQVASKPAGATVTVDGQFMGQTPTAFVWRGERAQRGKPLEVRLSKPGYAPRVVTKTIDNDVLAVDVTLVPGGDEATRPRPRAPASRGGKTGGGRRAAAVHGDDLLRQLEERARALQRVQDPSSGWDPVLKPGSSDSESRPEEGPPPTASQPESTLPSEVEPPSAQRELPSSRLPEAKASEQPEGN